MPQYYPYERGSLMETYIPVITKASCRKIRLSEVLYIEQQQRRLAIVTEDRTFLCYEKIDNIEKFLDDRFFHPLKKLFVNIEKIITVENQCITFENNVIIRIRRSSFIKTKQVYCTYLKGMYDDSQNQKKSDA